MDANQQHPFAVHSGTVTPTAGKIPFIAYAVINDGDKRASVAATARSSQAPVNCVRKELTLQLSFRNVGEKAGYFKCVLAPSPLVPLPRW